MAKIRPPIMLMARSWSIWVPLPMAKAIGSIAKAFDNIVMVIGLNLLAVAYRILFFNFSSVEFL